jgi:flagellar basal body P-ring formation protein FlgA
MHAMRLPLLTVGLLAAMFACPAHAAALRPFGILDGPLVRLSDLFDGIGVAGRRVLGPGPAPGGRITVPAAQLAAIAAEFGVDWRPRSPDEQVILERPGRPLRRAEVTGPLDAALVAAGAPADCRVLLPDFSPPEVPPGVAVDARVKQLDYDSGSGAFSAVVSIGAAGMDRIDVPLSGNAVRMVRVLVATHLLMPGTIVAAADLHPAAVPASTLRGAVATTAAAAEGMQVRRAVATGEPVRLDNLVPPPLVRRGQRVLIALAAPGLQLAEQGQALDTGGSGDQVRVLNPVSHAVLEATVTGPGQVRVAVGSLPLRGPGRGAHFGYPEYAAQ